MISEPQIDIFVQAAADLAYALTLYERKHKANAIRFLVSTSTDLYEHILALRLPGAEVLFIPNFLLPFPRYPWTLIRKRFQFERLYRRIYTRRFVQEAYFFCPLWDEITAAIAVRVARRAPVFLIDHYRLATTRDFRWSVQDMLHWLVYRITTGQSFYLWKQPDRIGVVSFVGLDYEKFGIASLALEVERQVVSKYKVRPRVETRPAVLLFEGAEADSAEFVDYVPTITRLISKLQDRGYAVYVKPHPRLGFSTFLESLRVRFLQAAIPAEFVDFSPFEAVIGVTSLALSAASRYGAGKVISLIDVIRFSDTGRVPGWKKHLADHGGERIMYPNSIAEVTAILDGVLEVSGR